MQDKRLGTGGDFRRMSFAACTLSLVVAPVLGQPENTQLQALQPEIRLPSITSRWKRPGEMEKPEITIEEIERCIGDDVGMQIEVNEVKQRQLQLEPELTELDNGSIALKQRAAAIEADRTRLQEQTVRFQSESANLGLQLSAIEKRKKLAPGSRTEANSINALVATYNADVVRHNKRRASLIRDKEALNRSVENHNAAVAEMSQRVSGFNNQYDAFQAMAAALTKKSEQYVANCTGERLIRK